MPIYAYRCSSCGHAKDVLQKMSDAPLSTCPACGAESFQKQVTAAGFQLKGSGWYVTDFKGGAGAAAATGAAVAPAASSAAADAPAAASSSDASSASSSSAGAACGGSCASH
ncbi:FmdB family zinc ribbon protein [Roseateles sp.]|uniref:FmdB family zinc ribbon protein n=1 Tax=Roseateles sp. TaxID=1971397 RepID=UPI003BA6E9E5